MLDLLKRTRRAKGAKLGAGLVVALLILVVVLPWFLRDPNVSDFSLTRPPDGGPPLPSFAHPLGTDQLRRDVLSRIASGGRISLGVGFFASTIATFLGASIGVLSATLRRAGLVFADGLVLRAVDVLLALPFLLFVTAIGVFVGHTTAVSVVVVLGLVSTVSVARVVRSRAIEVLERDFVDAARALGASHVRVAFTHVLPNVTGTALSLGTSLVGAMILAEAVLSYLSVGIEPPTSSWGRMLHEAETLLGTRPILVVAPATAIFLATSGFYRLGEALRIGISGKTERGSPLGRWPIDLGLAGAVALLVLLMPRPAVRALPPAKGGETPESGGELHLATFGNVATLDSAVAYDEVAVAIGRHVFGRLLTWDADGRVAPDLAEAYQWSDDRHTLTLTLRSGLVFQDGAPLVASDVKRSIERALSPKAACPEASHYAALLGYEAFRAGTAPTIDGIRTLSDTQVAFDLSRPSATFLSLLTLGFVSPVCPSSAPASDLRSGKLPCGAGPFKIAAIDPEDRIALVRNDDYYAKGLPHLAAIEWRMNVRPTSQRYRFERGELDFVRDLAAADVSLFANDPRLTDQRAWVQSTKTYAVFLNTELAPFDRREMRRAVALALDPSMLEGIRPDELAVDRVIPSALPSPRVEGLLRHHDLQAALAQMAAAGYPYDPTTKQGGYPEVIDYVAMAESFEQQAAEVYQQQLAAIGIRIRLDLVNYQTYQAKVSRRGAAQMGWAAWAADFPDPASFFDPMLSSRSIGETSANFAFFANAELDSVIDASESTTDEVARMALFARAEQIVADEAAWIPTHSARALEVWLPRLKGYAPNPLAPLDFSRTWLAGTSLPRSETP